MVLALPGHALAVERNVSVQFHPGHVDLLQLLPAGVALCRGHVRMGVDLVLEVVDQRTVGDELQRACQVAVIELAGVIAEEALFPGPGEEFHGHGVHFAGFHGRPVVFAGDAVAVRPDFERVTRFVGHNFHVVLRAVEVREDERALVVRQFRTVSAARFAFRGQHVQQFVVHHSREEFLRLGGQLAVELQAVRQDLVRRAEGLGIAAAERQRVVRVAHRVFLAETFRLLAVRQVGQGHDVFDHAGAELLHVLLGVAIAAHAVVAEGRVAFVTQFSAHLVAQMDQFVVVGVQSLLIVFIPLPFRFPGSQTARVVRVVLERGHLGQRVRAALEGDLRGSQQLLVGIGFVVLCLQQGDDLRLEGLESHVAIDEHQLAVFFGKLRTERAGQHGSHPGLIVFLKFGTQIVPPGLLFVIEFVAGVDGMADGDQGTQRIDVAAQFFVLQKDGFRLFVGLRGL